MAAVTLKGVSKSFGTNAVVRDPTIQKRFEDLGAVVAAPNSSEEFAKFIAENIDKWRKVIKFAGIKPI